MRRKYTIGIILICSEFAHRSVNQNVGTLEVVDYPKRSTVGVGRCVRRIKITLFVIAAGLLLQSSVMHRIINCRDSAVFLHLVTSLSDPLT